MNQQQPTEPITGILTILHGINLSTTHSIQQKSYILLTTKNKFLRQILSTPSLNYHPTHLLQLRALLQRWRALPQYPDPHHVFSSFAAAMLTTLATQCPDIFSVEWFRTTWISVATTTTTTTTTTTDVLRTIEETLTVLRDVQAGAASTRLDLAREAFQRCRPLLNARPQFDDSGALRDDGWSAR